MPIESPFIDELQARQNQIALLDFLEGRFGSVPSDVAEAIRSISDLQKLRELNRAAGQVPDLDAFRARLAPPPAQ